ncbi:UAA transporter [Spinellus fusiger]|nr:UAA transporter [Spinellus fusiger]
MLRFAICVAGIYTCFLTWGIIQERISTTAYGDDQSPKKFKFFIVLNTFQSLIAAFVAYIYIKATGKQLNLSTSPTGIYVKYAQVALLNCLASPFGYAALKHIDYPTMILGKSCKLVPVIFMNVLVYRRRFPLHKYICVFLITAGVSMFMLYQNTPSKAAGSNSMWGLFLLGMNLAIDGFTNATQDQIFHTYPNHGSGQHLMFFMNVFGFLFSFVYLVLNPYNNELWQAIQFFNDYPAVIWDVVLFGLCGAVGQCFIFYTLHKYGSLRLVTVTVTRKLFTMLLSVFWFNHVLSVGQWSGIALVFSAIGLEAFIKKQETSRLKKEHLAKKVNEEITKKE